MRKSIRILQIDHHRNDIGESERMKIANRWTGAVIYEGEYATIRLCLEAAVKSGANLSGADLYGANLSRADLSRCSLRACWSQPVSQTRMCSRDSLTEGRNDE